MKCDIEEWSKEILFRHELSSDERRRIKKITYANILKLSHTENIKTLPLYSSLKTFYSLNPGSYFIRLSTRSPKDSWYQLYCDGDQAMEDEINSEYTLDSVKRDLACLKVSNVDESLQVILHSERVYEDMEMENAVVLLPWRDIFHITETRCFILDGKLRCFTQYYNIEPPDVKQVFKLVCEFFSTYQSHYLNCVVDVHCPNYSTIEIVEINPANDDTETGYFTWEEIYELVELEYRYSSCGTPNSPHKVMKLNYQ